MKKNIIEVIKASRGWSFAAVAIIYVITAIFGIAIYNLLPFPFQWSLLVADVAATSLCFLFSLIFSNASVYDPYWSVQPPVILTTAAAMNGINAVRLLPLAAVFLWGIRLTLNWAYTFKGLNSQDWRYTMLREKCGKWYPFVNFAGIHLFPTLTVFLCTLPAVYLFKTEATLNFRCVLFFLVSAGAVLLQGMADRQMHLFRRKKQQGLIRTGLWKYSRHPNYLGEILMWWGIGLYCVCAMPQHFFLLSGALVNTLMFIFVSVPLAEGRQSEKPGFALYKKQTRMFLPIWKRQDDSETAIRESGK